MSRPTSAPALFLIGVLVVIAAMLVLVVGNPSGRTPATGTTGRSSSSNAASTPPSSRAAPRVGRSPVRASSTHPPESAPTSRRPAAAVQENPEALNPALRRAHDRLLRERPLFQHLPYRDSQVGVDFDRVAASGRLELLVTYICARSRAIRDLHGLLARYGDPGTAYVERYQRVF